MLESFGVETERFQLVWCSSAEADRFIAAMRNMNDLIVQLGPSPFRIGGRAITGEKEVAVCR
jgi:F420-non-reducing hydrogenase iron-sulfur subunit